VAPNPPDPADLADLGLFKVTGTWNALVDPLLSGSWSAPELIHVQGLVTFTPRIPAGSFLYLDDDTALALAPRYARIWDGKLANINTVDTEDVYLQANLVIGYQPVIGLGPNPSINLLDSIGISELVYDVTFSKVTFGGKPMTWEQTPDGVPAPTIIVSGKQEITPFAFIAPTDPTEEICLTSPALKRLPWGKPLKPQAPVG
jgi:hypothetical protein